ncbi:MAG: DUF5658 family protein [Actinomycetota bacterium]|nr:DUF5658 family protein [Actinomycetota bacterium]
MKVRVAELQMWEEPRELWLRSMLVAALLLLNVLDVLTTQASLANGGVELNPLSRWLIDNGMLAHAKVSVTAFIAVAAAAASNNRRVSELLARVTAFYILVVGANAVQLMLAA